MSLTEIPTIVHPVTRDDMSELIAPYVDNEDPDMRTHIVRPIDNEHITKGSKMSAKDIVDHGRMFGVEVVALCGYKWVPKHNPEKYDACQACFKVAELIQEGRIY